MANQIVKEKCTASAFYFKGHTNKEGMNTSIWLAADCLMACMFYHAVLT